MARFGPVVPALQQARVDLGMRAPVNGQQRLEDRLDRRLPAAGRDDAAGKPVTDPAPVMGAGVGGLGVVENGGLGGRAGGIRSSEIGGRL